MFILSAICLQIFRLVMPQKTSPSPPPQERGELNVDLLVDKLRHMSHLSTITENRYVISQKKYQFFLSCDMIFYKAVCFQSLLNSHGIKKKFTSPISRRWFCKKRRKKWFQCLFTLVIFFCTFSGLFNSIKEETPSTNPLAIVEEKAKEKRDVGLTENSMEAYPGPPPLPSVPITRTNTA